MTLAQGPAGRESAPEVSEDYSFQKKEWTVQRIGWVVMLLLIAAAAAGLLGSGPISSTSASAEGLEVQYLRFARLQTPEQLRVLIDGGSDRVEVWFDASFLSQKQIERITPEPAQVQCAGERYAFVFDAVEAEDTEITFHLRPDSPGRTRGRVGLSGGPAVDLWQFVYP